MLHELCIVIGLCAAFAFFGDKLVNWLANYLADREFKRGYFAQLALMEQDASDFSLFIDSEYDFRFPAEIFPDLANRSRSPIIDEISAEIFAKVNQ